MLLRGRRRFPGMWHEPTDDMHCLLLTAPLIVSPELPVSVPVGGSVGYRPLKMAEQGERRQSTKPRECAAFTNENSLFTVIRQCNDAFRVRAWAAWGYQRTRCQ